jgi:hypothetical protein
MKRILGIAAFVLVFSAPTHGQAFKGTGGAAPTATSTGAGTGGSLSGTSGARLPKYPAANFSATAVSGGDPSYSPSTFLTFEQAIAEGKAVEAANQKSLAQIAAENSNTPKTKAKFAFVQDAQGKVVPVRQQ